MENPKTAARVAIEVADWRQRVFAIYAEVRRLSAGGGTSGGGPEPASNGAEGAGVSRDASNGGASDIETAHRFWRDARDELFGSHPQTPLLPEDRDGFTGLAVAEYDAAWRFEVELVEPREPARFDFETGTDGVVPFELVGRAEVPNVGTLDVWRLMSYGGGLFLPVRDALSGGGGRASGVGTYGGGRYLLDTIKGAHLGGGARPGSLVLDFNFAYNPSCAYDPAWACPLAPLGNRVATEIPVGELYGA